MIDDKLEKGKSVPAFAAKSIWDVALGCQREQERQRSIIGVPKVDDGIRQEVTRKRITFYQEESSNPDAGSA